jgi:hypothetical protein
MLDDERFPSANASSPGLYKADYQEQFLLGGVLWDDFSEVQM